jgi:serine/threonine-protein kinase
LGPILIFSSWVGARRASLVLHDLSHPHDSSLQYSSLPKRTTLVRVPNVLGQTQNQASGTLTRSRLRMGNVGRKTASQPSGTVIQQDPRAGAMVKPGSAVDLWLAEPSEVKRVKVPDVRGKNQDQAANSLARVGLQSGRVAKKIDNRPAGTVIQQDPTPGSMVPPRTPVNLWPAEPRRPSRPPRFGAPPYYRPQP